MYRLPFELTDSAKLLHFTILGGGGPQTPRAPPLNDATVRHLQKKTSDGAVDDDELVVGLNDVRVSVTLCV